MEENELQFLFLNTDFAAAKFFVLLGEFDFAHCFVDLCEHLVGKYRSFRSRIFFGRGEQGFDRLGLEPEFV